jgi:hypothetical protein
MAKKIFILIFVLLLIGCKKNNAEPEVGTTLPGFDETFIYKAGETYTKNRLKEYTKLELMLMKAEVFARCGILKGNKWQIKYILSKKWFKRNKNANKSSLTVLARLNLTAIDKVVSSKRFFVREKDVLPSLNERGMYLNLKLVSKTKRLGLLNMPISKAWRSYLLKKEYGMEKRDSALKDLLLKIKGYNGFYVKYTDASGAIRKIINYAGCCSVILSDTPKDIYIFSSDGNLLKHDKFYYADKEAEHFYFYSDKGRLTKRIILTYNIEKKELSEAEVYYE